MTPPIFGAKQQLVAPAAALPGRADPVLTMPFFHRVFGDRLDREFPGAEVAYFGLGCFWGAEKVFWNTPGVLSTAVGYLGGYTPNPTYEEVCSGRTGHAEVVRVTFDPTQIDYPGLVKVFFEHHDPTQVMRQGNDVGTQYRSAIYVTDAQQQAIAEQVRADYQGALTQAGYGPISTSIEPAGPWYFAEDYHQQYLESNPNGYDCHVRTGVACPLPQQPL